VKQLTGFNVLFLFGWFLKWSELGALEIVAKFLRAEEPTVRIRACIKNSVTAVT